MTLELNGMSILISLLISLPIGIYSAIRQDSVGDYLTRSLGIIFISVPAFWTATMIMVYPAIYWGWGPSLELSRSKKPPLPPIASGEMGNVNARGFNKLGWHWWTADRAILSQPYQGRDKRINLGTCNSGCAQGAKSTPDITYWPLALRRKGVELKTNCRVREISINNEGMADGAIYS